MPIAWQKKCDDYSIIVWQSLESINDLLSGAQLDQVELNQWKSFRSLSRQREWLTVRSALKHLLPSSELSSIAYNTDGKPYLSGTNTISISHSNDFIAVMTGKTRIGVDIELIHPRIKKLSEKFLSDDEKKHNQADGDLNKLHVFWGAKEVLYKIHSVGGIDFKKDFFVHPFNADNSGELTASILKKRFERDYEIHYEKIMDYMLAWAVDK